ncbi:ABC transporter ATP-binding protein [Sulfolobus tengchongensis]|uniref:ABC transporter ATP-binding protein n=1 Tax=Sulfolobus tengchongensis TaxID=207809 RepID=A0AAX4KZD6_9CREN
MLIVKSISVNIGNKNILSNISFSASKGINVILGPNGSGKTTLLKAIIGMMKYKGEIIINGSVSFVPAEFFSPKMKVIDVIMSGRKRANYYYFIKELNLIEFLDRDFSTLSSGEKKLVLISKALAEGENVIMDEPLSNLDIKNRFNIMRILRKFDKTFLITSHELEVLRYADKVIIINKGQLKYDGSISDLSEDVLYDAYGIKFKKIKIDDEVFFKPEVSL